MTLMFVLIVVTVTLAMVQKLAVRVPPDAEMSETSGTGEPDETLDLAKLRLAIQILTTAVGLVGGGYIILYSGYSIDVQLWAAGLIGLVLGFWLK